ncbi:MAG TPA: ABC transporter substrate-binding protein [Trueperaceae bacterium]|nr:ABC transporter substrate-binding protein [Trueperaceae bacterium]
MLVLGTAYAQTVNIEVWHSLGESFGAPEFEAIANRFNDVQDEIVVEVVYAGGYTDALQRAQAAAAAGNLPNVAMFEQTRGAGFVDAGNVLALNSYLENDPEANTDDLFERLLSTCTYGDTLYCMPYNNSTPLLYYNGDLFREVGLDPETDAPTTWEELHDVAAKFAQEENGQLTRWGIGLATSPGWLMDAYLGQAGGRFLNEAGDEFVFDGEAGVATFNYWLQLIEDKAAIASSSQTEDFFSGRQAMMMASTANLVNYFDTATFDLHAAQLPCNVECYAPIGGGNFYIMDVGDQAEHDASWEFMKWILSPENAAEFAAATGYMAPRPSALETPTLVEAFASLPEARITYDQMASHGYSRTLVPFWNEVHNAYGIATEEVLLAGIPPEEALSVAAQEANRLLDVYAR